MTSKRTRAICWITCRITPLPCCACICIVNSYSVWWHMFTALVPTGIMVIWTPASSVPSNVPAAVSFAVISPNTTPAECWRRIIFTGPMLDRWRYIADNRLHLYQSSNRHLLVQRRLGIVVRAGVPYGISVTRLHFWTPLSDATS